MSVHLAHVLTLLVLAAAVGTWRRTGRLNARAEAERLRRERAHFRRYGDTAAPLVHLGDGPWWCLWHPRQTSTAGLDAALDHPHLCRRCRPSVFAELDKRTKEECK